MDSDDIFTVVCNPSESSDIMTETNKEIMTIAMIEDKNALENLPEILCVDGLDVVAIGPFDLAQSLSETNPDSPIVVEEIENAVDQIRSSGKIYENDYMIRVDALELFHQGAISYLAGQRED